MYILADIGGTKTRIAKSDDLATFSTPTIIDTPMEYEEGIRALTGAAKEAVSGGDIEGVALGMTGVLVEGKTSTFASNSPGWDGKPIAKDVSSALGASVMMENDTALVGLGEAHFGAGKGAEIFSYITISTGVNGVRIVDGRIDRSAQGFEIGEQYLSMAGGADTLGEMISGTAIEQRFGVHPKELGKEHEVWEELARIAAYGIHNTILHWSPERIAIGGSMVNDIGIPVDRIGHHLEAIMHKFPTLPEIVHAELGDLGGLWGGLALLRQEDVASS